MRSHFVVFDAPSFDLSLGVIQPHEPVLTEALEPNDSVEALGVRVGRELEAIVAQRGKPDVIVSDNGTEFTSMAILR
jgi:hypothetical protein